MESVKRTIEKCKKETEEANARAETYLEKNKVLETQLSERESAIGELKNKLQLTVSAQERAEASLLQLKEQVASVNELVASNDANTRKIQFLENQLSEAHDLMTKTNEKLNGSNSGLDEIKRKLEQTEKARADLERQHEALQKKHNDVFSELDALKKELADLN